MLEESKDSHNSLPLKTKTRLVFYSNFFFLLPNNKNNSVTTRNPSHARSDQPDTPVEIRKMSFNFKGFLYQKVFGDNVEKYVTRPDLHTRPSFVFLAQIN